MSATSARLRALLACLLLACCGNPEPSAPEPANRPAAAREAKPSGSGAQSPASPPARSPRTYEPTAAELPLPADFVQAAARRVRPENYRDELARVERELSLEAREPREPLRRTRATR